MLYGGIVPIAIILLFNGIIFLAIMISLARRPDIGSSRKKDMKRQVRIAVSCVCLLGIAWMFGVFVNIRDGEMVFLVLFCVFNAFQGLAVFLLQTLRNPIVIAQLKTM